MGAFGPRLPFIDDHDVASLIQEGHIQEDGNQKTDNEVTQGLHTTHQRNLGLYEVDEGRRRSRLVTWQSSDMPAE